jgi:hypothetical protein
MYSLNEPNECWTLLGRILSNGMGFPRFARALLVATLGVGACGITTRTVEEQTDQGEGGSNGGTATNGHENRVPLAGRRSTTPPQTGAGGTTSPAGAGGAAPKPGSAGMPPQTGAGQTGTSGRPTVPVGGATGEGDCFDALAKGLRCEGAEAHAQGPYLERVASATMLWQCEEACRQRPDCGGVSDYFQEPALPLCYLDYGSCEPVTMGGWEEEDAGKQYRKVCPAGKPCYLEYLGNWVRCESTSSGTSKAVKTNLEDCQAACLKDPTCTGITDYFYLSDVPGCYLYTASCNAPQPLPFGDTGQSYTRVPCK